MYPIRTFNVQNKSSEWSKDTSAERVDYTVKSKVSKVKVKYLCLTKNHAMEAYWGVEV
jgi:hypothetical protein